MGGNQLSFDDKEKRMIPALSLLKNAPALFPKYKSQRLSNLRKQKENLEHLIEYEKKEELKKSYESSLFVVKEEIEELSKLNVQKSAA